VGGGEQEKQKNVGKQRRIKKQFLINFFMKKKTQSESGMDKGGKGVAAFYKQSSKHMLDFMGDPFLFIHIMHLL
jgi:hypothetical protein